MNYLGFLLRKPTTAARKGVLMGAGTKWEERGVSGSYRSTKQHARVMDQEGSFGEPRMAVFESPWRSKGELFS